MGGLASSSGAAGQADVEIVHWRGERMLAAPTSVSGLEGQDVERDGARVRLVPLSAAAAARVRELLSWAKPKPFGSVGSSFGFGDRLGLATTGHIQAMLQSGGSLRPVFAQQSARELERTGRSFADVLDAATWAVLDAGWTTGFGADADHLKSSADLSGALAAGFSMLTLDPSALVDTSAARASRGELERRVRELPWEALEDDWAALRRRHAGLADDERVLARAATTYGAAVAHVAALARDADGLRRGVDIEVSLDETELPTSPFDHTFVATELQRLGVPFTGLAPRFAGRWEKAVDVGGDLAALRRSIEAHVEVAERLGPYRLSVHSGSDKPTLYRMLADAGGTWHVKTSGTSYLEALRVVARRDPELMRRVLAVAASNLERDRATYAIATAATLPDPRDAVDAELPALLDLPDARQCLHVTYGAVLRDVDLGERLRSALEERADEYASTLEAHFARHLDPLAALA